MIPLDPAQVARLEILELKPQGTDWLDCKVAYDGCLAPPFSVPKSYRYEEFPTDDEFERFLVRQTETLLTEYGDQRHRA